MATFLFKFSACLAVFWLVYVLLLERQTVHRFKRFYLLGSLVLSLLIPQFTITRYVQPVVNTIETPLMELPSTMTAVEVPNDLQGSMEFNGETFYYTTSQGKTTYYNLKGEEVKMDNVPPFPQHPPRLNQPTNS